MKLHNYIQRERVIRYISVILFILYISYLTYLTLFDHGYGRQFLNRSINLIPFKTILQYLMNTSSIRAIIVNIAGNIAAFLPMGFLLPLVWDKCRNFKICCLIILMATICIEVLQYITGAGASDIDDVILNCLGGMLGYFLLFNTLMKTKYDRRVS
ncbi:MAG: VanZ family protein [Eubacteriaceae bacterium]